MKFVKVKEIPGVKKYHPLKNRWEEFMAMNVKVVKVDLDEREYKSATVAAGVMQASIKRHGYPITVVRRGNEIYLIRRDM